MTWRLALALIVVLALAILWSAPPTVYVHGRVMLTACGGAEPLHPPPGWSPCTTTAVSGATFIFAPANGEVSTGVTNARGEYRLDLEPGTYIVAARGTRPVEFASQPAWVIIPVKPTMTLDMGAIFSAP